MPARVAEILAHRNAFVRRQELHRRRIRRSCFNDNRICHRPIVFQRLYNLCYGRGLLPDGNVNTDYVFALLVDDRIHGDRGLSRLAIADDQLALSAADRHHRIDRLKTRLKRLLHRLSIDNTWRHALDFVELLGDDRTLVIDRVAERIHHSTDHCFAHRHTHDPAGALYHVAFFDRLVVAKQHDADLVFFKVQRQAPDFVGKLEQLAGHDLFQAMNLCDTVPYLDNSANFGHGHAGLKVLYLTANDFVDLVCFDRFHKISSLHHSKIFNHYHTNLSTTSVR